MVGRESKRSTRSQAQGRLGIPEKPYDYSGGEQRDFVNDKQLDLKSRHIKCEGV